MNSTHRPPRCGALNSHLTLWCICTTIVFWATATLHIAAVGVNLEPPPSPGPLLQRAFFVSATRDGVHHSRGRSLGYAPEFLPFDHADSDTTDDIVGLIAQLAEDRWL